MLEHHISGMESKFNSQTSAIQFQVMLLLPSQLVQRDSMIVENELTDLVSAYGNTFSSHVALKPEML